MYHFPFSPFLAWGYDRRAFPGPLRRRTSPPVSPSPVPTRAEGLGDTCPAARSPLDKEPFGLPQCPNLCRNAFSLLPRLKADLNHCTLLALRKQQDAETLEKPECGGKKKARG